MGRVADDCCIYSWFVVPRYCCFFFDDGFEVKYRIDTKSRRLAMIHSKSYFVALPLV